MITRSRQVEREVRLIRVTADEVREIITKTLLELAARYEKHANNYWVQALAAQDDISRQNLTQLERDDRIRSETFALAAKSASGTNIKPTVNPIHKHE